MTHLITEYLPYGLSCITLWFNWLAGSRSRWTWVIALVGQMLWLEWIVASHSWGFLPMNLSLWAVYLRNHIKWRKP